jgi:adenosine deaminase
MIKIPKIELHCHLDGSLRPGTVLDMGLKLGLFSEFTVEQDIANLLKVDSTCDSLATYLEKFNLPIEILQSEAVLERVSYELYEDAYNDGVRYMEMRFAPHLHTKGGLTIRQVIQSVLRGMNRATRDYAIFGNVILSHLRHHSESMLYTLLESGREFLRQGVVAVDLCGNEQKHFSSKFVEAIQFARNIGYRVTIHAGETGFSDNITEAISLLGASRIGHGVAMMDHPEVMAFVKEQGVLIEACPTSNLHTKAIHDLTKHPIHNFYKNGVAININTDNRTVSDISLSQEYMVINEMFTWVETDFKKVYIMALDASFCDDDTKHKLMKALD